MKKFHKELMQRARDVGLNVLRFEERRNHARIYINTSAGERFAVVSQSPSDRRALDNALGDLVRLHRGVAVTVRA